MSTSTPPASRTITLGHSPDSDDAFMFHALANHKIDTGGLRFEHVLRDIQTLNDWARDGRLDSTALSVHAYAYVADRYALLSHGASLGDGYGPMLVAKKPLARKDLERATIAVPGKLTSAYLALRLYLDHFEEAVMPFDRILEAVQDDTVDVGLLIHEGQLTHPGEGLSLIEDLGIWWQRETGLPLPLGVNTVRRDLGPALMAQVSKAMKESIRYALDHRSEALDYALSFARDMPRALADRFVDMYVNHWTLDLGERGKAAIRELLTRGAAKGILPSVPSFDFVD